NAKKSSKAAVFTLLVQGIGRRREGDGSLARWHSSALQINPLAFIDLAHESHRTGNVDRASALCVARRRREKAIRALMWHP
ncbi:hypothetical protein, partial [Staphylococcus aureus]